MIKVNYVLELIPMQRVGQITTPICVYHEGRNGCLIGSQDKSFQCYMMLTHAKGWMLIY